MKIQLAIFTLLITVQSFAQLANRWNYSVPLDHYEVIDNSLNKSNRITYLNAQALQNAKFYMLNGQFESAKVVLNTLNSNSYKINSIKLRYLSIISFIEGANSKTESYLNDPLMQKYESFTASCILRSINYIILGKNKQADLTWKRC